MQTLRDQYLTARKKHTCSFCGCVIEKGNAYRRQTIVYDGDIYDWLSHRECDRALSALGMFDEVPHDEGLTADDFQNRVDEYLSDNGIDCEGDMLRKVKVALAHAKEKQEENSNSKNYDTLSQLHRLRTQVECG